MLVDYEQFRSAASPRWDLEPSLDLTDLAAPKYGLHEVKHPEIAINGYRCRLYSVKAGLDNRFVFPQGVAGYKENGFYRDGSGQRVEELVIFSKWDSARVDMVTRAFGGDSNSPRERQLVWTVGPLGAVSAEAAAMGSCSWDRAAVNPETEQGDTPLYVRMQVKDLRAACLGGEVKTVTTLGKLGETSMWLNHRQVMMSGKDEFYPLSSGRSLIVFDPHPFTDEPKERVEDLDLTGFKSLGRSFSPSQEDVMLFGIGSGDLNPAHRDKKYMERTRFKRGPIAYGQLITLWSIREGLKNLQAQDSTKSLDSLDVTFNKPLVIGETAVSPWLKPPTGEETQYQLLALDQNMRSVIDLKFGVK